MERSEGDVSETVGQAVRPYGPTLGVSVDKGKPDSPEPIATEVSSVANDKEFEQLAGQEHGDKKKGEAASSRGPWRDRCL